MNVPSVSVIIATYGRGPTLCDTIEHLLKCNYPTWDLTVVDQTPSYPPEVQARIDGLRQAHRIQYIKPPIANLPMARNIGIRAAKGEIIIFCDDDVIVDKDYISNHVKPYRDPSVGSVAGRILGVDHILVDGEKPIGRVLFDGTPTKNFQLDTRCEVDWGVGCNMSFRRSALERAGNFDERYDGCCYCEDHDVFARLKKTGVKIMFEPDAVLTHLAVPAGGCRRNPKEVTMRSWFRNETLLFLTGRDWRYLPRFLIRTAKWMKATVQSGGYPRAKFFYFLGAFPLAVKAYFFENPHGLSRKIKV